MGNNRFRVLALGLFWASGVVVAQQTPAPAPDPAAAAASDTVAAVPAAAPVVEQPRPLNNPGGATLGDLDHIQGEILLAEAKAKLADARLNLAKSEGGASFELDSSGPPVVAGVFGPATRPYARFLLPDGSQLTGREGDLLNGGYRVVRVGVDKVVIKDKKGREVVARFSGSAPATQSATPSTSAASTRPITPYPGDR